MVAVSTISAKSASAASVIHGNGFGQLPQRGTPGPDAGSRLVRPQCWQPTSCGRARKPAAPRPGSAGPADGGNLVCAQGDSRSGDVVRDMIGGSAARDGRHVWRPGEQP